MTIANAEARIARLESDQETFLHVLGDAVQQLELLRNDVAALHDLTTRHVDQHIASQLAPVGLGSGPDGFQVPAPRSSVEGDSRPALIIHVACATCQVVSPHRVEVVSDGLLVCCSNGVTRRPTRGQRDAVRLAAARLIGSTRHDEIREEACRR